MKLENNYEVVISGIGGLFPRCENIEVFKQGLLNNENLMGSRWKAGERGVSNVIGTIPQRENFDASYFGIHREQCNFMDPMQRLVMERTYEAIIDAGVNPVDIKGKKIAVYAGSSVGENDNLFYESIVSGFGVTGHSRSMMPNRISYWLNLIGPSSAYDNNWLNGIEVLQSAYEVVRTGQVEAALVSTANLALNSEISWIYNDMGLLSPDGKTRSFDANANGYGRSDGIVALYIQRACDAKRAYATILGVDSRFNGLRDGPFREVNEDHITSFIEKFYESVEVDPRDVEFVECYGCGHANIDAAELNAIDRAYCKNRDKPLLVGSVKPNAGHSEASAILFSLAKVLVAMESGIIPATIDYDSPNPKCNGLLEGRIEVVAKNKEWISGLAAINGIGIGSSYGHVLLKANPKPKTKVSDDEYLPRLINISTRTEEGAEKILTTLKAEGNIDPEYAALIQDTFKKAIPGHLYRAYAVLGGTEEANAEFEYYPGNKREVWFVYSGMGSQWCKMATDLMVLPIFAKAIYKCHEVLKPKGIDLLTIVTGDDETMFENILHSFVGIAAVQIGLTDVLHAVGIVPDGIIGHSVGELGCAYADGCLSAEQMILCAYSRGRASLEASLIRGMMAAVGMGYSQIKKQCPPSIEVACHNGPDSSTISGPTEDMEAFVKQLQDKGLFARLVNVSNIAYHSRYIKPAAPLLLKYLQEVIPEPLPRSSKWISTSIPEDQWDTDLAKTSSAEYHTNNLLSSVLFEEGSTHIPKEAIVIEIAPHGLLQAILRRSLKANTTNIPLTRKTSKNGLHFLLAAIGKIYLAGLDLNISALYPKVKYPVARGTKSLTPLIHWEHSENWRSGTEDKLNHLASVRDLDISLKNEQYRDLVGHQLQDTIIIPTSTYLALFYEILNGIQLAKVNEIVFENLKFMNVVRIPKIGSVSVYVMMQKGNGDFEISSGNELIATGKVRIPDIEKLLTDIPKTEISEDSLELTGSDVYSEFYHRNHKYGGEFRIIKSLRLCQEGSIGMVKYNNWCYLIEAMIQQCLFHKGEREQNTLMISSIQRIAMSLPDLPEESKDLEVNYNYATGIISTSGIQIFGITTKPLKVTEMQNRPVSCNAIKLTQLFSVNYESIESAINLGLQIAMENFEDKDVRNVMIVEIQTKNASLESNIKNVLNRNSHLCPSVSTVRNAKDILISQTQPMYVLMNSTPNIDCINLVISSHVFLLTCTDKSILSNPEVTQMAELSVNGVSYSLIRKSPKLVPSVVIPIKADTLTFKDFLRTNLSWVSQIKSALQQAQKVYVVSSIVPSEGINNFFKNVGTLFDIQNVRFVFLLDKNVPEFTLNEPSYQKIFKDDLVLTVIKNGCTSTYVSASTEFENDIAIQTTSNIIANTSLKYIGINVRDETLLFKGEHKPELGNIDYSGVTSSGQRIAGLAHLDLDFCKLVPDPVLWWELPGRWTFEDAATAPHAYVLAYYALIIQGRLSPSETVLIHGGCSAYGLAAISVASKHGCSVFTTVTSEKQKAFMKKQFMFMTDANVFNARNTSFEPHILMATGGQGAHLILNCLSGSMLSATLRCVAEFGKILQIGKLDVEDNSEIGMRIFLKNVSLASISVEDVFNASIEVKQRLHDLIAAGLKSFTVRPLFRAIVNHQDIRSILSTLKQPEHIGKVVIKLSDNLALSQLNVNHPSQFICDPHQSYLIYGGSAEMWTDVLEWLLLRGARKFVVSSDSKPHQAHINRRLKLYQSYYNIEILFSLTKAQTRDSASALLSAAHTLGPIGAMFILPNKDSKSRQSEIKAVQYLESVLKTTVPKALFVNFFSEAAGTCQLRADAGFPTHNIQWENELEFADVLFALDDILRLKIEDSFVKNECNKEKIEESAQSFYKKLSLLLPNSVAKLKEKTVDAPTTPDFILLPSLCTRIAREIPPVFVIPGMFGRSSTEDLAKKIFYPVYCANFPAHTLPLKTIAASLAGRIKEIQSKGPYNLIGVSYGGVLALEIAKILEQENHKIKLQFLDGAPDTVQGILKHLGEGHNSEIGLLCRILNLTNPEIAKQLNNLPNWEARLKFALEYYECPVEDKSFLSEVLTALKTHLDEVTSFQPSGNLLVGQVCLLRPSGSNKYDVCGLQKYCKENALVRLVDGNHSTILKEKVTAQFINDKVMC